MTTIAELEKGVFVASQLSESDFALLPAIGIRSVVANRPDGEADDQLPHPAAQAAARRNGLQFRYQPVESVETTDDSVVADFARLMGELEGPVLFYCRTGNRSSLLWAQAAANRLGVDSVIAAAAKIGCDFEPIRDIIEDRVEAVAA